MRAFLILFASASLALWGCDSDSTPGDSGENDASTGTGDAATDGGGATENPSTYLFVAEKSGELTVYRLDDTTFAPTKVTSLKRSGYTNFGAFASSEDIFYTTAGVEVRAFSINADPVELEFLGSAEGNELGTHVAVDATGSFAFQASFGGNEFLAYPLGTDGVPKDFTFSKGGDAEPEHCKNTHQVAIHPGNRFIYTPCLGSDHVAVYDFDAAMGTIASLSSVDVQNGAGPRHMAFHPDKDVAYLANERDSTVNVFTVNTTTGALAEIQSISTVPMDDPASKTSDIHVSPDGDYVYVINREPLNDIVRFAVGADGKLTFEARTPTGGDHARSFVINDAGTLVVVGNTNSQTVTFFERDPADGSLTAMGDETLTMADKVFYVGLLVL